MDRNPKDLGLLIITSSLVNRPFASPLEPLFEGDSTSLYEYQFSFILKLGLITINISYLDSL